MKKKTAKPILSQKTLLALIGFAVLIAAVVWYQRGGISADENTTRVTLTNLEPNSGSIGTEILVRGAGFTIDDNTVTIGSITKSGLSSPDGTSILMYVPQDLAEGNYSVTVKNKQGTSNAEKFTVSK